LPGWRVLSQRDAAAWESEPGIGPGRAAQLQAFFRHPETAKLAAQLRAAGVDGF
jgi:DNA ligase (NAD+)